MAMRWRWPPDSFTPRSPTRLRFVAAPARQVAQAQDKLMRLGAAGGGDHLGVAGLRAAVA